MGLAGAGGAVEEDTPRQVLAGRPQAGSVLRHSEHDRFDSCQAAGRQDDVIGGEAGAFDEVDHGVGKRGWPGQCGGAVLRGGTLQRGGTLHRVEAGGRRAEADDSTAQ